MTVCFTPTAWRVFHTALCSGLIQIAPKLKLEPVQGSPNGVLALLQQVIHNQTSQQQQIQLLSEQQQRQNQEQATLASMAMQLVGGSSAAAGFGLAGLGAPLSSFITPLQGQLLGEVWHSSSGRGVAAGASCVLRTSPLEMEGSFTRFS